MAFLDDVLVRVDDEAKKVEIGRMLLTAIAAVLFGIGWILGRAVTVLGVVLRWSFAAVKVGWQEGRKRQPTHTR